MAMVCAIVLLAMFTFSVSCLAVAIMSYYWWVSPVLLYRRLRRSGFSGPNPSFPFGNLAEMTRKTMFDSKKSNEISHDIQASVSPFYARWQKAHGKVFVYWLGTEPFLYVADPEFLRKISSGVLGQNWGKPTLLKKDRYPMFGKGLNMVEGEEWVRHRHIITPAFSPANLKGMTSTMVDSTRSGLARWEALLKSGNEEIDMSSEISRMSGEIIARTAFGLSYEEGREVLEKLRALQVTLYSSYFVGVPFGEFMTPKRTLKSRKLGKEIDRLILDMIEKRKRKMKDGETQTDLLGLLLAAGTDTKDSLSLEILVDECKTFFFGGHDTTALSLTWTLLCLAMYPKWQDELREEIKEVIGVKEIDYSMLPKLKKMNLVMQEVLRLYTSAPNAQRQTRKEVTIDGQTIPKDTNIWIDIVSMHHDPDLWGDDVFEFKPERFIDDPLYGGCKHKMGYIPFGFGGRMCIGRNLTTAEYKTVLSVLLSKISFSVSPKYRHQPTTLMTLVPAYGLPLIVRPL